MIVGITGGIGCGKSTVARLFRVFGYPVYDADQRARLLQSTDQQLIEKMIQLLGEEVRQNGGIDRKKVAAKVFPNPALLEKLNNLIHPRVHQDYEDWLSRQKSEIVFRESALLVETGAWRGCDYLMVVSSPEDLRIKRVMQRDGVAESEVRARMERQAPEEEKRAKAHFVIENDEKRLLIPQVEKVIQRLTLS